MKQPNILLIVSDDQGYPDPGCIGTKPVETQQSSPTSTLRIDPPQYPLPMLAIREEPLVRTRAVAFSVKKYHLLFPS